MPLRTRRVDPPKLPPHGIIRIPALGTLRRYGLTPEEWLAILERQGGACAVCRKVPTNGRLCTDHEHVPKWKKMRAAERKRYVRGLLCFFCNHYYVGRAITVMKAANILTYLKEYEERRCHSEQAST